jgi:hypothetical protein
LLSCCEKERDALAGWLKGQVVVLAAAQGLADF